ncbi:MAG: apolipoprotein N-acyltransferase, partial [Phycisphaerales bacterium]|nr:apolipoprotein N-acyltransferase [Phycisphaerales bacterium]
MAQQKKHTHPLPPPTEPIPLTTSRAKAKAFSTLLMLVTTDILLTLLFPPFYCFFLAPVALAPLCICVLRRPMNLKYLFFYYLAGVGFFLPNLYWLMPVTVLGTFLLSLFLGLYFAIFAFGFHRLTNGLRIPATFAVPLVWTAVEWVRSVFLEGGFPWFMLGNSLAPAPVFIQIADLFGVWGATFFIAMLNGLVVDILRLPLKREGRFNPILARLTAAGILVTLFVIAYGVYRLGEKTIHPGPRVAVIQDNIPQYVKDNPNSSADIFRKHIDLTREAAQASPLFLKPDLIVWPETMVPEPVNREMLEFPAADLTSKGQEDLAKIKETDAQLRRLCDETGVSLLVGSPGLILLDHNQQQRQNLTLLYEPGLGQSDQVYAKVHLVPFGEYIPFRKLPLIGPYMKYISPYKDHFDYSNEPGKIWTRFLLSIREMRVMASPPPLQPATTTTPSPESIETTTRFYHFATPICFEDTMPEPARKMVSPK